MHAPVQLLRMKKQVPDAFSIGVVVQGFAQCPQHPDIGAGHTKHCRMGIRPGAKIVPERRHYRPGSKASFEISVNDQAGADIRRSIDMRFEPRVVRNLTGVMVIEVAHMSPAVQRVTQRLPISIKRNIEYGEHIARLGRHPRQQSDVALYASYQLGLPGFGKAQLMQCAQAVGVAVEDVIESQIVPSIRCPSRFGTLPNNMSTSFPFVSRRYARSSRLVSYLSLAYLLLVVYASLYPFADWRVPNDDATQFLLAGWPSYITASDIVLNVLAYFPIGLLLTLIWMGVLPPWLAVALGFASGTALSLTIEFAQAYQPMRVSSNVDVLTNSIGALWGCAAARVWGEHWLLSGNLHRLRKNHFQAGAGTDLALLLLALWLVTQFNAKIWLFGNGDLRHLIPSNIGLQYSSGTYVLLEAGIAALNFAGVGFLIGSITRSFAATAVSVAAAMLAALMLKTIASMALFVPGDPGLWLTPGSMLGLAAGMMLWLLLARRPPVSSARAAGVCIAGGFLLVNIAPENPYLAAALQVFQGGQFLRFNAMTELLSSLWPLMVFGYLLFLNRNTADRRDAGTSVN